MGEERSDMRKVICWVLGHRWDYAYASVRMGWLEHGWYCRRCSRHEHTVEYNDAVMKRITGEHDNRIPRPGKRGW